MALAGMEADFKLINSARKPVAALSILTFLLPAVAGYYVYSYFRPDDFPGKLLYASLFASHSVGIVFPVIRELKLTKTRFGASVLISTVVTDIASIILLAVSVQMKRQSLGVAAANGNRTLSLFDYVDPGHVRELVHAALPHHRAGLPGRLGLRGLQARQIPAPALQAGRGHADHDPAADHSRNRALRGIPRSESRGRRIHRRGSRCRGS